MPRLPRGAIKDNRSRHHGHGSRADSGIDRRRRFGQDRFEFVQQGRGSANIGWGRRLLEKAVVAAAHDGCLRLELDTSDRQVAACRLYEAAGFTLERETGRTCYYVKRLADLGT